LADEPTDLDKHRGLMAQKETEQRRNQQQIQSDQSGLKARHEELENHLSASPARNWAEVAEKTRYLLSLFAHTPEAIDPRRRMLIQAVLDDFDHLLAPQATNNDNEIS
jgi:hypothetical protein